MLLSKYRWLSRLFSIALVVVLSCSAAVSVFAVSPITTVATDSAVGTSSLRMTGGEKIIEDSFGKLLVVYVDSGGRLALRVSNGDPTQTGAWNLIAKSPTPAVAYDRPAAILLSSNSMRIIVEGGTGTGRLVDVPVTLVRGSGGSVTGATFGSPLVIDNSGNAAFPSAILAHDGSIIIVWNVRKSGTFSKVNSLRWTGQNGWRAVSNPSSTLPDSPIVDTKNTERIYPNIIERPDNFKLYVAGDRGASSSQTNLVFNSATFDGSKWNWGIQNLSYVTNASRGLHDATDMVWDPVRSLVLIVFDITEKNRYGVRGIDSQGRTTVLDTPDFPITNNEWGTLLVHPQTGNYYLFMLDTPSGGSSNYGKLKYATRSGGAWGSTLTTIDSDTNNYGIATKKSTRNSIDILYGKGTKAPASIRFARIATVQCAGDCVSPSKPQNLAATAVSSARVDLSWQISSDNVGVAGYEITRNGVKLATLGTVTSYSDRSVSPSTSYTYTVAAFDSAGNRSPESNPSSVTTPPGPGATVLVFRPTDDTYVRFDMPGSNFGSDIRLAVDNSPVRDMLLKFNVEGVGSKQVTSAKLRLFQVDSSPKGGDFFTVHGGDWSESTVTWITAPAAATLVASLGPVSTNTWYEADITFIVSGDGVISLRTTSTNSDGAYYSSKEGVQSPQLVITLSG